VIMQISNTARLQDLEGTDRTPVIENTVIRIQQAYPCSGISHFNKN
jgi:hypothetical protein